MAQFLDTIAVKTGWLKTGLWFGWLMALLSSLSFSIAPAISRGAITAGMNPGTLLAIRLLLSTALLGGSIMLVAPGQLTIDRRGLLICSAAGLANGIGMYSFFWALNWLNASIASMIFSLSPLAVLALLALRGEKFTYRHTIRLALGLSGVYLLIGPGGSAAGNINGWGVTLILITIVMFAIHLSLIQWFLQGYEAQTVTFYVVSVMTIVAVALWLLQGAEWHNPGWMGWLAAIVLAVISTYLARLTLFVGVRYLGSGQIALLLPLETLFSVLWSLLFLQERLSLWQWVGGILILISAALAVNRLRWAHWRPRWRVWSRV